MPGHASGDGIALGLLALARDDALLGVMLRRLDAQRVPASNVVVAVDNATLPIATLMSIRSVALFESGCRRQKGSCARQPRCCDTSSCGYPMPTGTCGSHSIASSCTRTCERLVNVAIEPLRLRGLCKSADHN